MKKLILLSLLLYQVTSAGAQIDSLGLKAEWNNAFKNFTGLPAIPTGYLWDRALPDSTVWFFKGLKTDSVADYGHWGNIYQYWVNASNNTSNTLLAYDSVRFKMESYFKKGVSVVPFLHIIADKINEKVAFDSGRVQWDSSSGVFVINSTQRLFHQEITIISAPFIQVSFQSSVRLYFGRDFYFTNTGTSISKIRISLNKGAYFYVPLDSVSQVSLSAGLNILSIEYFMSNGKTYYAQTSVLASDPKNGNGNHTPSGTDPFHFGNSEGNIYATPRRETETNEPLGAYVDYVAGRTNGILNTCIKKPVIFVEGIDFGYKDHSTGCYGGKCGSLGLKDLLDGKLYNPYETKEKKAYEDWDAIKKAPDLISELQKRGYDLFYLDFHNGADYMENNAMLLVELIQLINKRKCTNEEIVVMGASMGGIVAKYALAYMEKNSLPHCTRTYLSFDAPHRGANIPLGMQYQLEYYKGLIPGIKDNYKRKIDRAATKQLLTYHCMVGDYAGEHGLRTTFVNSLRGLGNYPAYTRNIALINGTVNAGDQGFSAGDKLLAINPYVGKVWGDNVKFTSTMYAAYAMEGVVLEAKFTLKKKSYRKVAWNMSQNDHVPGSMRFDLKESRAIYGFFNAVNFHDATCFIPSISGLDVNTRDQYYNINANIGRTSPHGMYPFHSYSGPFDSNEEHVKITTNNIRWIIEELEKNRVELPLVLNSVYNYGQYERFMFRSTKIITGAKLQFNGQFNTGFGNGPFDKTPVAGSAFEAYSTDCSPLVTIESGGEIVVGDNNANKNKAIVHFRKGSTLAIAAGGVLRIHDQSQLIIEEGAKLIYYPGARIILEGENAVLQMDGVLRLEANAVFSIEKGKAATTGFMKYRNVGGGYGRAKIEVVGNMTRMDLTGTGKTSDCILQIEGEMILPNISPANRLKEIRISNAIVLYGNQSKIIANSSVIMQEVKFANLPWAAANMSDALVINGPENCRITNCQFSDFNMGIKCDGGGLSAIINIDYTTFERCFTGLYCKDRGVNMTGSIFDRCQVKGAYFVSPSNDLKFVGCQFRNNLSGLEIDNNNMQPGYVFIQDGSFYFNQTGLQMMQCQAVVACTQFINNNTGISTVNGELNLSRTRTTRSLLNTMNGGNNTFAYNGIGIKLSGTVLFLNDGFNNFIQNKNLSPYQFVVGNIAFSSLTHQMTPPYALMAANNYWQPYPTSGLMEAAMTYYFVLYAIPGGSSTMNYFGGSVLNSANTLCYKSNGGCSPCEKTAPNALPSASDVYGDVETSMVKMMNSPVINELKMELQWPDQISACRLRFINLEGKVLLDFIAESPSVHLNVSQFAEGVYFLELSTGGQKEIRKVLISR